MNLNWLDIMAKCKHCLFHVPTGILITEIWFDKKSQAIGFLNRLPVNKQSGLFNPPKIIGFIQSQSILDFVLLYKWLYFGGKSDPYKVFELRDNYHKMNTHGPTEFIVIPIKYDLLE